MGVIGACVSAMISGPVGCLTGVCSPCFTDVFCCVPSIFCGGCGGVCNALAGFVVGLTTEVFLALDFLTSGDVDLAGMLDECLSYFG